MLVMCKGCDGNFSDIPCGPYCSVDCYIKNRPSRGPKAIPETRFCPICNKGFVIGGPVRGSRKAQIYCSNPCKRRIHDIKSKKLCNKLTPEQAAYFAGFLDGEGSIIFYLRNKNSDKIRLRLLLTNTKLSVLNKMIEWCGVGHIVTKISKNVKHNTSYMFVCNSYAAHSIIIQITPYLLIKQEQAILANDMIEKLKSPILRADTTWQKEYRAKMKYLNRRGT